MSLSEKLEAYQMGSEHQLPEPLQKKLDEHIDLHRQSEDGKGLLLGDTAMDFEIDSRHTLYDYLIKGPVVLTFFRGSWCTYCNLQLEAYENITNQIESLGATIIAVGLQKKIGAQEIAEKIHHRYPVVVDTNGTIARNYKVLYDLDKELQAVYETLGVSLDSENNDGRWHLPTTATFIIDRKGLIRHKFLNEDYKKRMEPEQILNILEVIH